MDDNQHLSFLYCLFEKRFTPANGWYLPKTTINISKRDLQFLRIFLSLQSFIDEPNMRDVTLKVQPNMRDGLSRLSLPDIFELQNKISLIKVEIKAKYSFPKITSLPISADKGIPKFVKEFVHFVAENLPVLLKIDDPETMERVKDVLKELELLNFFACFVSERCIDSQSHHVTNLFTHVLAVACHAAMLTWLYLPELDLEEINVLLSDFLRMRIKPIQPCIRKIYVDVLQSLKSTMIDVAIRMVSPHPK